MSDLKSIIIGGAVLFASAVAVPAFAHHSFPATYKMEERQEVTGTVVQFMFRNPHSFVHVMAPDKDGKVQRWAIEWGGGAALSGQGVTAASLKPGDKVVVRGQPGRNPADHRMRMLKITRPSDGWAWGGNFD